MIPDESRLIVVMPLGLGNSSSEVNASFCPCPDRASPAASNTDACATQQRVAEMAWRRAPPLSLRQASAPPPSRACLSSSRSACSLKLAAGCASPVAAVLGRARRTRFGEQPPPLEAEGWRLRHSLLYRGRGDIDSVAIAPTEIAFVVETKTRTFDAHHLASVREMAACLCRQRRCWSPRGALPVLCVVRARGLERVQDEVLFVSLDRLVVALRTAAGASQRPAFLVGEAPAR